MTESIAQNDPRISREEGIVRDIVMFAPKPVEETANLYRSESGNYYASSFFDSAYKALEGAIIYDTHGEAFDGNRSVVKDTLGRFKDVRLVQIGSERKIVGNAVAKPSVKEQFIEAIQQFGDAAGFSIKGYTRGGFAESGEFVHEGFADTKRKPSCDLVDCSGATTNVFESLPPKHNEGETMEIKTVEELRAAYPQLATEIEAAATKAAQEQIAPRLQAAEQAETELKTLRRKQLVHDKCAEHKLDEAALTANFRKVLEGCEEAEVSNLIHDLAEALAPKAVVTGNGIDKTAETFSAPKTETLDADKIVKILG